MPRPVFAAQGRCGRAVRFKFMVFYACEGLIVCQDERPHANGKGDFKVILPDDLDQRVNTMAAGDKRSCTGAAYFLNGQQRSWIRQEYNVNTRAYNELKDCIKEAKAMGDPSDPTVQAFWRRHRPGSKSTVSMRPKGCRDDFYDELPALDLGNYTGRTAEADGTLADVPNVHSKDFTIYKPPVKKNRAGIILG